MKFAAAVLPLVLIASIAHAEDWPQWRGPRRDGISTETGWLRAWPAGKSPPVAWRAAVGKGHSANGRAYTMGWDGERDTVFCLDAATGKVLWKQTYPCLGIKQWPGPRSTPTVHGNSLYTLGQHGQLRAWNAATGQPLWKLDLPETYMPDEDYGFAWSPLIVGDLLILPAGSRGLAIRTQDGSYAWGNDGKHGACASPVPYSFHGRSGVMVVITNPGRDNVSVIGIDPATGNEQWRLGTWNEKWGAFCIDPIFAGGSFFIATAEEYRRGARFSLRDGKPVQDWANPGLSCYTGHGVVIDNHLYIAAANGMLKCADWRTGRETWSQRGFDNHSSLIAADGKLIVQSSRTGELAIVEANSKAYRELRRLKVFTSKLDTFTAPTLGNARIYSRSYAGEVVCIDLSAP